MKKLQEQNDRKINFEHLVRYYVGLDSRLKAIEENFEKFFDNRLKKHLMFS